MGLVLAWTESGCRLSMITPDRYPIRNFSQGKSVVTKGAECALQGRRHVHRRSRRGPRTPVSVHPSQTARR
jgi:hypothetical protein